MNPRRCRACKQPLTRWGGRLYCINAACPGSVLDPENHEINNEMVAQLTLPGLHLEVG